MLFHLNNVITQIVNVSALTKNNKSYNTNNNRWITKIIKIWNNNNKFY